MRTLIAASLLLVSVVLGQQRNFQIEQNTIRLGSTTIDTFTDSSVEDCQARCEREESCHSFTVNPQGDCSIDGAEASPCAEFRRGWTTGIDIGRAQDLPQPQTGMGPRTADTIWFCEGYPESFQENCEHDIQQVAPQCEDAAFFRDTGNSFICYCLAGASRGLNENPDIIAWWDLQ